MKLIEFLGLRPLTPPSRARRRLRSNLHEYRRTPKAPHRDPAQEPRAGAGAGGNTTTAITSPLAGGTTQSAGAGTGLMGAVTGHFGLLGGQPIVMSQAVWQRLLQPASTPARSVPRGDPLMGEVVAYRGWKLKDDRLFSLIADAEWKPGEPMEGDVDGWAMAMPVPTGVYAWDSRDACHQHAIETMCNQGPVYNYIIGTVNLYGEVVRHQRGYRAQFAQIASLDEIISFTRAEPGVLDAVRRRYGVEAT